MCMGGGGTGTETETKDALERASEPPSTSLLPLPPAPRPARPSVRPSVHFSPFSLYPPLNPPPYPRVTIPGDCPPPTCRKAVAPEDLPVNRRGPFLQRPPMLHAETTPPRPGFRAASGSNGACFTLPLLPNHPVVLSTFANLQEREWQVKSFSTELLDAMQQGRTGLPLSPEGITHMQAG